MTYLGSRGLVAPAADTGDGMVETGFLAADLAEVAVADTLRSRIKRQERMSRRRSNSIDEAMKGNGIIFANRKCPERGLRE